MEVLYNQSLASNQSWGGIFHETFHGLENGVQVPVEGGLDRSNTNTLLLRFLLLAGVDNELEQMSSYLERGTQITGLVDIGGGIQKVQVAPDEARRHEGEIELLIRVVVNQRAQVETSVMNNAKNGDEIVED